jgi:hypothetical protein
VGQRVVTLQQELAAQVTALQAAVTKVTRLESLLPICSYCKSVRGDHDYWEAVDSYISEHTNIRFSHGICPDCFEKAAAELEVVPNPSQRPD